MSTRLSILAREALVLGIMLAIWIAGVVAFESLPGGLLS